MPVKMRLDGLADFTQALYSLPDDLAAEGKTIVHQAAEAAETEIASAYPKRTGSLKDHMLVEHQDQGLEALSVVRNTAPHAGLFEYGTQARHTSLGANRGSMPAGHVFVPIAMRKRRGMYEQLMALLERAGFRVSGNV